MSKRHISTVFQVNFVVVLVMQGQLCNLLLLEGFNELPGLQGKPLPQDFIS